MEEILAGLRELEGVRGSFVFTQGGKVVCLHCHAIYDRELLQEVSRSVIKAIDSLALQHPDWEEMSAQFADARLLLRSLGKAFLGVIADSTLNSSFANVAVRVAVGKLKARIASGGLEEQAAAPQAAAASTPSAPVAAGSAAAAVASASGLSSSGLTWSGLGQSAVGSGIAVADKASSAFLSSCSAALARSVGPMSKVFVKEAVRKIVPQGVFSREHIQQLLNELENHISDPEERAEFRRKLLVG